MALSINFEFAIKLFHYSGMQITLLSFLFKKFNIIKKGININNTLKLYAVLFSCFIYAEIYEKGQSQAKAVGF
jgi:hypothetical protein